MQEYAHVHKERNIRAEEEKINLLMALDSLAVTSHCVGFYSQNSLGR